MANTWTGTPSAGLLEKKAVVSAVSGGHLAWATSEPTGWSTSDAVITWNDYDTEVANDGTNPTGLSCPTKAEASTYALTAPAAPTGLTATLVSGDAQVDLAWTDNSDNEDGFNIFRRNNTDGGGYSQIDSVGAGVTTYSDTGLPASYENDTAEYYVQAHNTAGTADSNSDTVVLDGKPSAPSGVTTSWSSLSCVVFVSWTDNSNNEQGFRVYRDSTLQTTTGENTTSYNDGTAAASTSYTYEVSAFNAWGESTKASDNITTGTCDGPS